MLRMLIPKQFKGRNLLQPKFFFIVAQNLTMKWAWFKKHKNLQAGPNKSKTRGPKI